MESFPDLIDLGLLSEEALKHNPLCCLWKKRMCSFLQTRQWDKVLPFPVDEYDCSYCMYSSHPLQADILRQAIGEEEEYPPALQTALLRMYGHWTSSEWMSLFRAHCPSVPLLRLLFREGRLSPDESTPFTLLSHHVVWWSPPHLEFLLGPEAGVNVNLQTPLGNTALLQFLRSVYSDEEEEKEMEWRHKEEEWKCTLDRMDYLLRHGADPLLANREGVSPLSYVEGLTSFTHEQKERILARLRCHI